MQVSITVKNVDEIRQAFKKAPRETTVQLNKAISKIILKIQASAMREAPVNKQTGGGNLRQSIKSRMDGNLRGMIEVGASYGVYVHEGTMPHTIQIRSARVLANQRTGQIFGTRVEHPGTAPNPFLQRAVDQNESYIDAQFKEAVATVFRNIL